MYARLTGDTNAFVKVVDFPTELTEEEKEAMTKSNETHRSLMTDLEARGYYKLQDLLSLGYGSDRYLALLREEFGGQPIVMTAIFRKVGDQWKVVYPNRPRDSAP